MSHTKSELIHQEMGETRANLTEKIARLEDRVYDTVEYVNSSVQETVHSVTSAVDGSVHAVADSWKRSLESVADGLEHAVQVRQCVRDHPWSSVGASAVGGFLLGVMIGRPRSITGTARPLTTAPADNRPTWASQLMDLISRETARVVESAVTAASSRLRASVATELPRLIDSGFAAVRDLNRPPTACSTVREPAGSWSASQA